MCSLSMLLLLCLLIATALQSSNAFVTVPSKHAPQHRWTTSNAGSAFFVQSTSSDDESTYEKDFVVEQLEKLMHDSRTSAMSLVEAEAAHGMPWKSSIDASVTDKELLYMPFWEWQMSFMKENLTNLKVEPCSNANYDFTYNENAKKKARMVNLCLSSDEYRKIRLTYYDAGDNTQVFNSVWYPRADYNLPVLGIDLLAFNRKKYLAIVDFQPLHADEKDHANTFEHLLQPIKRKYDALKGKMSAKFYDETQFFSQQMLFARFEDESIIRKELYPAFQAYVQTHLDLLRQTEPNHDKADFVMERQKAYDTYSAERDPATGLFTAMFGEEWATAFVHDFLFSMSERTDCESPATPTMPAQQPQERQPSNSVPAENVYSQRR